jgi:hypothetical protein
MPAMDELVSKHHYGGEGVGEAGGLRSGYCAHTQTEINEHMLHWCRLSGVFVCRTRHIEVTE